ncbi:MAG: holo-ACP synthase [Deltaproteobacteria bacterium]|nr:holo-ACP synthase [Deltaproteobacteria bacterium]
MSGIGIDVVHLPSFRDQLVDPGSAFVAGTFTRAEIAASEGRADGDPARHLAARFAAKEAFLKAWASMHWGEALRLEPPIDLREIEVELDAWGRPRLVLTGAVARTIGPVRALVSMSHDGPIATAIVQLAPEHRTEATDE